MTEKIESLNVEEGLFVAAHIITPPEATRTLNTAPIHRYPPEDPTLDQQMKLVEESGVLDFWDRPEEDGYTDNDGEPI